MALRAETIDRTHRWASSKKVWIGQTMNSAYPKKLISSPTLSRPADHLAGAEPGEHHQEQPGEQHAGRLHERLPDPGRGSGLPGPLRLVRVVAGEGVLAADAAQDPQPGDDVGRHPGQVGRAGPLDLLAALQRGQQRQREHHDQRRGDQHHDPERDRGGQHQAGDHQVRRQRAERPGEDLGQGAELVGVAGRDTQHLAGRRPLRQHVAQLHRLAVDHHHRAVHPDQPGADDHRVVEHAGGHADQHQAEQDQAQLAHPAEVAGDDALVDDPADHVRADRARHPLQHGGHRRDEQHQPLLGEQPAQEPGRTAGVRVGEGASRPERARVRPRGGGPW